MENAVYPSIKRINGTGNFAMSLEDKISIRPAKGTLLPQAQLISTYLTRAGCKDLHLQVEGANPLSRATLSLSLNESLKDDGYTIIAERDTDDAERFRCSLSGKNITALSYACYSFLKLLEVTETGIDLPLVSIEDWPTNPLRQIIVSVGWNQIYEGPSKWALEDWKNFIDLLVEMKYNILYFCDWEAEWVFPFDWYKTRMSNRLREYSVMPTIRFSRWNGEKMVDTEWRHPFLTEPEMLHEIIRHAHTMGLRIGFFATPHFVCVEKHQDHLDYWKYILGFLIDEYHFDAFMFEDEETTEAYHHLKSCEMCRARWGEVPFSRTKRESAVSRFYYETIKAKNPKAVIGGVPHCFLHTLGVPKEEYGWFENLDNYERNLREFDTTVPERFLVNWIPDAEGEERFTRLWFEVLGDRIVAGGYNGYWPLFRGNQELAAVGRSEELWNGRRDSGFSFWSNLETTLGREAVERTSRLLFGPGYHFGRLIDRLRISPDFRRTLEIAKGYDTPSRIEELEELFSRNSAGDFIREVAQAHEALSGLLDEMTSEAAKTRSRLICSWDVSPGVRSTLGYARKSLHSLQYLISYHAFLSAERNGQDTAEQQRNLERIGRGICEAMVEYIPDWPGTGNRQELKVRGAYQIPCGQPVLYDAYLTHAKGLARTGPVR